MTRETRSWYATLSFAFAFAIWFSAILFQLTVYHSLRILGTRLQTKFDLCGKLSFICNQLSLTTSFYFPNIIVFRVWLLLSWQFLLIYFLLLLFIFHLCIFLYTELSLMRKFQILLETSCLSFEARNLSIKALKKEVLQFHKQSKYLCRLPLLSEVFPGIGIVNGMEFTHYLIIHTAFKLHEERVGTWGKALDQLKPTLYATLKGPN